MTRTFRAFIIAAAFLAGALNCAAADPVRVSPVTAERQAVSKVEPKYPAMAKQLGVAGVVAVDVTVDEDGAVQKATIVEGNPILGSAAVAAAKGWKFHPFQQDGKAVAIITRLSFRFTL